MATDALDEAARHYLAGRTAQANELVSVARERDPAYFAGLSMETEALQAELTNATATEKVQRGEESDHYTDAYAETYWNAARREFDGDPTKIAGALIAQIMREKVGGAIAELNPDAVLDFGCMCGLPLYRLACTFPDTEFRGIDRNENVRVFNDRAFKAHNLRFAAGDVLDYLDQTPGSRKMLVHVRTGIMVYPAFLERLYRSAKENGFRYVVLYEIASLSCVSWTFREQGSGFASEAHRSTMFLHDYVSALLRAGFTNARAERMPHGYSLTRNNMLPGDTYVFVTAEV